MLIIFSSFSHCASQGFSCRWRKGCCEPGLPPAPLPLALAGAGLPPREGEAWRAASHLGLQVPQADDGFLVLGGGVLVAAQLEEPVSFSVQDGHRLHLLRVAQAPGLPLVLARRLHLPRSRRSARRARAPAPSR